MRKFSVRVEPRDRKFPGTGRSAVRSIPAAHSSIEGNFFHHSRKNGVFPPHLCAHAGGLPPADVTPGLQLQQALLAGRAPGHPPAPPPVSVRITGGAFRVKGQGWCGVSKHLPWLACVENTHILQINETRKFLRWNEPTATEAPNSRPPQRRLNRRSAGILNVPPFKARQS